jgi:hypothetical protein
VRERERERERERQRKRLEIDRIKHKKKVKMSQSSSTKQKLQREKVAQFISLTQSSEKHAINFLQQYDWKLDVATDAYYNSLDTYSSSSTGSHHNTSSGVSRNNRESNKITIDKKKLDQIWTLYKGW